MRLEAGDSPGQKPLDTRTVSWSSELDSSPKGESGSPLECLSRNGTSLGNVGYLARAVQRRGAKAGQEVQSPESWADS